MPDDSDRFTMFVIVGARTEIHCLTMDVGTGSSSHCLEGDCSTNLVISSVEASRNSESSAGVPDGCGKCGDWLTDGIFELSLETLSEKKMANCCAIDVTVLRFGKEGVADLCSRPLTVFQSWRGLEQLAEIRCE